MPGLPKKVGIRDVTYREGDDCPGFTLSVDEKMQLLHYAVDMGIEEIDIGGPSMHPHQFQFAEAVKASGLNLRRTGRFFANTTMDYKKAADICMASGSTNIRIVIMALNEEEILKQLKVFPAMVEYCHTQHNAEVCWSLSDTLRVRMDLIQKVYEEGLAAGGDKASVNDTFGVATPAIMRYLSSKIATIGLLRNLFSQLWGHVSLLEYWNNAVMVFLNLGINNAPHREVRRYNLQPAIYNLFLFRYLVTGISPAEPKYFLVMPFTTHRPFVVRKIPMSSFESAS